MKNNFKTRYEKFNKEKIIIAGIRHFESIYDKNNEYLAGKSTLVLLKNSPDISYEVILGILNSKLISFYLKECYSSSGMDGGINFSPDMIRSLPLPEIDDKSEGIIKEVVNKIISDINSYYKKLYEILNFIKYEFHIDKFSKKLIKFEKLKFDELAIQLKIEKMKYEKKEELMKWFENNKKELIKLKNKILTIDKEINHIVYDLYGLSDEEIEIVEKS